MLTFSLNVDKYCDEFVKNSKQVVDSMTTYNRDYAGEAFLAAVEGKGNNRVNLDGYANKATSTQALKTQQYDSLDEKIGSLEDVFSCGFEDEVIEDLDLYSRAEDFLDLREYLFLKRGCDILRLVYLVAFQKDVSAAHRLRLIMVEANETEMLRELFKNDKLITEIWSRLRPHRNHYCIQY